MTNQNRIINSGKVIPITIADFVKETNPSGPIAVWTTPKQMGMPNEDYAKQVVKTICELHRLDKIGIPIDKEALSREQKYPERLLIDNPMAQELIKTGVGLFLPGCECCAGFTFADLFENYSKGKVRIVLPDIDYNRRLYACSKSNFSIHTSTDLNHFRYIVGW